MEVDWLGNPNAVSLFSSLSIVAIHLYVGQEVKKARQDQARVTASDFCKRRGRKVLCSVTFCPVMESI